MMCKNGQNAFTPRGDRDSIVSLPGVGGGGFGMQLKVSNPGIRIQDSYLEDSYSIH